MLGLLRDRAPDPILTEDECRENGYIVRDCPECYEAFTGHSDDRNIGIAYYYCRTCGDQWYPDRRWPDAPTPLDIAINLTFVVFLAVGFVGCMVTAALLAKHTGRIHTRDDLALWSLAGIPAWAVLVTVCTTLIRWITYAIHAGIDYVWGEPLTGRREA
jgi:hypothetical protein